MWALALVLPFSYLLGAIPSGLVLGKIMRGIDLREYGSGKTGAANVLRTLGWGASIGVGVADVAKGVIVVLLARSLLVSDWAVVAAALAAVIGHNWSVYMGFRGGRGVNTSLGGLLAMSPLIAVLLMVMALAVIAVTRYVSLGSILGAAFGSLLVAIFVVAGWQPLFLFVYITIAAALLILQHRDNIGRLLAGKERRVGERIPTRQPD